MTPGFGLEEHTLKISWVPQDPLPYRRSNAALMEFAEIEFFAFERRATLHCRYESSESNCLSSRFRIGL